MARMEMNDGSLLPLFDSCTHAEPKKGEIWKLGEHRLMCGDSMSEEDVRALMGGQKAERLFTDPPYGMSYQSNHVDKKNQFHAIENDDKFLDFLPVAKKYIDGFVFVCTTWKVLDRWLPIFKKNYELTNMIVWNKGGQTGGLGDLKKTFRNTYELILTSNCGHEIKGKRIESVWNCFSDNPSEYIHPTQKPVGLARLAIEECTDEGDKVLDLFGGSGSTLIACEETGRKCMMMELSDEYCKKIIWRWEEYTGGKAERI